MGYFEVTNLTLTYKLEFTVALKMAAAAGSSTEHPFSFEYSATSQYENYRFEDGSYAETQPNFNANSFIITNA